MTEILEFLKDLLLWVPRKLWAELLEALQALIHSLPVPDFVADASGYFSAISGNILFFAQKLAVGEGITMILGALVLRFILRRIPLIG